MSSRSAAHGVTAGAEGAGGGGGRPASGPPHAGASRGAGSGGTPRRSRPGPCSQDGPTAGPLREAGRHDRDTGLGVRMHPAGSVRTKGRRRWARAGCRVQGCVTWAGRCRTCQPSPPLSRAHGSGAHTCREGRADGRVRLGHALSPRLPARPPEVPAMPLSPPGPRNSTGGFSPSWRRHEEEGRTETPRETQGDPHGDPTMGTLTDRHVTAGVSFRRGPRDESTCLIPPSFPPPVSAFRASSSPAGTVFSVEVVTMPSSERGGQIYGGIKRAGGRRFPSVGGTFCRREKRPGPRAGRRAPRSRGAPVPGSDRSQSRRPPRKTPLNCRDALTSRGFAVVRRRLLQVSVYCPPHPGHPAPGPVPGAPRTQLRPAGPHLPRCEAVDPANSSRYNIGENLPLPPHALPPACFRDLLLLFVRWKHVSESRAPTGGGARAGAGCQSQAGRRGRLLKGESAVQWL